MQRNRNASPEPYRHENVLDANSANHEIVAWLSSIHGGDTIQLIPRAEFPAWVNFVLSAEMQISGQLELENTTVSREVIDSPLSPASFYRPLSHNSKEIRLLSISPGLFGDPLSCSLETVSLRDSNHIKFEALSYCWSTSNDGRPIHLKVRQPSGDYESNEYEVFITSNLYDALRHLRPKTGAPRVLWADALCINQHNLGERSHQVSLMRAIYSGAEQVVVWLGPSTPDSKHCFRIVQSIAARYQSQYHASTTSHERANTERLHEPMMFHELLPFMHSWQRCEFAWFRRTWVLQEVANAQVAVVHCGFDVLPWPVVVRLADCVVKAKQQTELFRYTLMPPVFSRLFEITENGQITRSNPLGILEVLLEGQALDASDPRDKIFALLQFGAETSSMQDLSPEIRPDYRKSTAQVFIDFTKWWIRTHKSLRILSAVHTARHRGWQRMSSTPPPDLSTLDHPSWSFWVGGTSSWAKATLGLSKGSPFRASSTTSPDLSVLDSSPANSSLLRLVGHRVCTVGEIQPYPLFEVDGSIARLRPPSEMRDAFISIFDPVGTMRTWIWEREDHKPRHRPGDNAWYRDHLMTHFLPVEGGLSLPCYTPCYFNSQNTSGDVQAGLCPDGIRTGDIVVILHGGKVPYILRENKSRNGESHSEHSTFHEFVGECYLEGVMHGEIMSQLTTEPETFDIT